MPRVYTSLPNMSTSVVALEATVAFTPDKRGENTVMVSDELTPELLEHFLAIDGYKRMPEKKGKAGEGGDGGETPA